MLKEGCMITTRNPIGPSEGFAADAYYCKQRQPGVNNYGVECAV